MYNQTQSKKNLLNRWQGWKRTNNTTEKMALLVIDEDFLRVENWLVFFENFW